MSETIKKETPRLLLLGILLQFAILLTMMALAARPLAVGETVLLRVVPVDPRDAFRGDYMALGYAGIPARTEDKKLWGQVIYASLTRDVDGKHWTPGALSLRRPEARYYLQGRCQTSGKPEFSIESFYFQSGTGKGYDDAIRANKLSAEIALTSDGKAAVRRLVIE